MLSAPYEAPTTFSECSRGEPRTNMFVMAKLYAGGCTYTVKVRNMSPGGALVEGTGLPRPNTPCRLIRGELSLEADVIRSLGSKRGLKFRERTSIDGWLPSGGKTQIEVDKVVAHVRTEAVRVPLTRTDEPLVASKLSAEDVHSIANALAALADDLSDDTAMIARYATRLQTLDISVQTMRKFATMLAGQ